MEEENNGGNNGHYIVAIQSPNSNRPQCRQLIFDATPTKIHFDSVIGPTCFVYLEQFRPIGAEVEA